MGRKLRPGGVLLCLLAAIVAGLVWLHFGPHLSALLAFGQAGHVPGPPSLHVIFASGRKQRRRLGGSRFASAGAYHAAKVTLSGVQQSRYFDEGYLLLRNFLPAATVAALREELLRTCAPFESNGWLESDEFLDFLAFGPFGHLAAQLLGGNRSVHLLRSLHHFRRRQRRIPNYHYDHSECQTGFPPARAVARAMIKFWIPLYDDSPGMHFMNQSALESQLLSRFGQEAVDAFRKDRLLPPKNLCTGWVCQSWVPEIPTNVIDGLILKPLLQMGDVIVHSTTLVHRSPIIVEERTTGFVSATYGVAETRFSGTPYGNERECDPGTPAPQTTPPLVQRVPRIADVPRPSCYPQVYPAAPQPQRELHLILREADLYGVGHSPLARYLKFRRWSWTFLVPDSSAPPAAATVADTPGNVVHCASPADPEGWRAAAEHTRLANKSGERAAHISAGQPSTAKLGTLEEL